MKLMAAHIYHQDRDFCFAPAKTPFVSSYKGRQAVSMRRQGLNKKPPEQFKCDWRTIHSSASETKFDATGTLWPIHHFHVTAVNVKVSRNQRGDDRSVSP